MIRTFVREVGGKQIAVDLDTKDLKIGADLLVACGEVSGTIGLVGELVADRTTRLTIVDAEYRQWRAKKADVITGSTEKIAEWKVKDQIEADPHFLNHKTEIAALEGDLEFLKAYQEALRVKAQMIRARVDLARIVSEGGAIGYDMRAEDEKGVAARSRDEGVRAAMTRPAKGGKAGPKE